MICGFAVGAWADDGRAARPDAAADSAVSKPADKRLSARQSVLWTRSCGLCHVDGNAGAPRIGHLSEWSARLAQGEDVLLHNTLKGLNNMPPLGYCMACESEDFRAMIRFMASTVQVGKR